MIPARLLQLHEKLSTLSREPWHAYSVPGIWVGSDEPLTFSGAPQYLMHQLERVFQAILHGHRTAPLGSTSSLVYNGMARHVTAYNHGKGVAEDGWRLDGSFVKTIALIPYLLDLGVTTLSLLPVVDRGVVGRKGSLGSPYAARYPVRLDPDLAEPSLGLGADAEFRALIEACHAVGIKVVVDVVLRTASIDSDLVPHHPEWFYWVDEGALDAIGGRMMAPEFSSDQIAEARERIDSNRFDELPVPLESYRDMFTAPPRVVERDARGWLGIGVDGRRQRIPGAFADWPPDDPQPAWSDVTYLRLHDHADYRYMAYNTIRMFERKLERPEYRQSLLWNLIAQIIPHFVRVYGVDGAMIDMGHALPADLRRRVIAEARFAHPDVVIWEENFHLQPSSKVAGYDASLGYLPFDAHHNDKLRDFLHRVADNNIPIAYLSTPESHNTPRAASREGGIDRMLCAWTLLRILPRGIPFIHAGMEIGETHPVNTGLGFTPEETAQYPAESLPLFSSAQLPWDEGYLVAREIADLHKAIGASAWSKQTTMHDSITVIEHESVLGFLRRCGTSRHAVVVLANLSDASASVSVNMPTDVGRVGIHEGVEFDEGTGTFTWKARPWGYIVVAALLTSA